ncbi:hypothetical protein C0995_014419 [Termitomyces sp. Mi166|nr:hypothetical protein C0995_014419 [Termitomyces sp. Mi166\
MAPESPRPYTANAARPTTAAGRAAFYDQHNPQYTYGDYDEEEEDEESDDEDVFAFLPPSTAEQQHHHHHLHVAPDNPLSPPFSKSPLLAFPAPTFDPYSRFPADSGVGPSTPQRQYFQPPPESPPSTDSNNHNSPANHYRLRRINSPGTAVSAQRPTTPESRQVRVSLPAGDHLSVTPSEKDLDMEAATSRRRHPKRHESSITDSLSLGPSLAQDDDETSRDASIKMEFDFDAIDDEDSPFPEVRASVSNIDDPDMPALTLRMWLVGLILCMISRPQAYHKDHSGLNVFFNFRSPAPTVVPLALLLISYPCGKFLAFTLPITTYRIPIPHLPSSIVPIPNANTSRVVLFLTNLIRPLAYPRSFEFSLNPGPWNIKEHVLVFIMANVAVGNPYALNAVVVSEIYYDLDFGYWFALVLVLATQLTGFGLAGLTRRFLVWPASMVWPQNLVACTLLNTLHAEDEDDGVGFGFRSNGKGMSRYRFFMISWSLAYFPISANEPYDRYGQIYDIKRVLTKEDRFDLDAYNTYSPLYLPATYAMTYLLAFALSTCVIVHTLLYHGRSLLNGIKKMKVESDDIHAKLMRNYPEVPEWWYLSAFTVFFALAVVAVETFEQRADVVLGVGHERTSLGIVTLVASSNYIYPSFRVHLCDDGPGFSGKNVIDLGILQITLNILAQIIPGTLMPGNPMANMLFKAYSVQTLAEATSFIQDLKLGHYIKVPPRATFLVQLVATTMAAFVQVGVKTWIFANVKDICDPQQKSQLTCPHNQVFFTASAVWGLIGPSRQFGPGSIYHPHLYAMVIGVFLPIPFWFWQRRYPDSWFKYVSTPVILNGVSAIPPATGINYSSWFAVGFIFQYLIRKRNFAWWSKFNYVLSAALDSGMSPPFMDRVGRWLTLMYVLTRIRSLVKKSVEDFFCSSPSMARSPWIGGEIGFINESLLLTVMGTAADWQRTPYLKIPEGGIPQPQPQ